MSIKLMLLGALGGLSVAGQELKVIETDAGRMVEVPLEHVEAALSHGLVDLDTAMADAEAESARLVLAASEAVARAKAAKQAKSSAPPAPPPPDPAKVAQAEADAAQVAADDATKAAEALAAVKDATSTTGGAA